MLDVKQPSGTKHTKYQKLCLLAYLRAIGTADESLARRMYFRSLGK